MQKEKLEPFKIINKGESNLNRLISYYNNEIDGSEFIIKEDYNCSIFQWRYKKKLDRLLEKLYAKTKL